MQTSVRRIGRHAIAATFLCIALPAFAQGVSAPIRPTAPSNAEAVRIERLAALARLWGEAKYFHPRLAYQGIDWDRALVDAIPRVNAARSGREYQAAIEHLLAALGDDGTYVEPATPTAVGLSTKPKIDMKTMVRLEGDVLHVQAAPMADDLEREYTDDRDTQALALVTDPLPHASALVLDLRSDRPVASDFSFRFYQEDLFPAVIEKRPDHLLTLGALRYRSYDGFRSQGRSYDSAARYSAVVDEKPFQLAGNGKTPLPPTVVLINRNSPDMGELLAGMQAAGMIAIVAEGGATPYGDHGRTIAMPDGFQVHLRTSELVAPDGSVGPRADLVVAEGKGDTAIAQALQRLRSRQQGHVAPPAVPAMRLIDTDDDAYPGMAFPSKDYRLLALFRFWNVIEHFYPYKDLIGGTIHNATAGGGSWDDVLQRYIPLMEADRDQADYQITLRQLIAELHDSHGVIDGDKEASAHRLGIYLPPMQLGFLQGHTVVLRVLDDKTGLRVGDTIDTVDGRPMAALRADTARITPASTPQALERDTNGNVLRGQKDSRIRLGVTGLDGARREVTVARDVARDDPRWWPQEKPKLPVFGVLPDGYGYVDLGRLQRGEVDAMFEAIKGTRATIFDMRGYPNGTAWTIAPRLTRHRHIAGPEFWMPNPSGKDESSDDIATGNHLITQHVPDPTGAPYLGKVVMLIGPDTQSQAEHTCLFFEEATDVTFIGTPTAGANGDIVNLFMPGGFTFTFTGLGVRHADGRQLQRLGIQPHIRVEQTIQGVISGTDEVLEAAEGYLEKGWTRGK